ncbi:unnamed protein product [Medioppia subpectinata]|uniref:BHLH domain-containing protein n=1 Tax=Medioppia subpectinata TaxID=1979941 RepID=A0A7R9PU65_9ACAR|nr:unnamed protein product [Medioppia subpectinata]CAG2100451.1 unnamed protein product [Medioppia subpectinata]
MKTSNFKLKTTFTAKNAERERSRVKCLRQAFQRLQLCLPSVPPNTKLSKLDVLILATNYISYLTKLVTTQDSGLNADIAFKCDLKFLHPIKKWPMRSRLYSMPDSMDTNVDINCALSETSICVQHVLPHPKTLDPMAAAPKETVKTMAMTIHSASGFRTDMETLLAKFESKNSTKFIVFSQCFRDMSFSLIFRGRHNDNEMHEFIDEIFLEVLSQLVNRERPLCQRIGSLYLLYALYVKQPLDQTLKTRFDIKVRITLDQLKIIREFVAKCKANRILDVVYVWYKLLTTGVHFVFFRYQCSGPSNTRSNNHHFQGFKSSTDKAINDLKKSLESRFKPIEENHNLFVEYKEKAFNGSEHPIEDKPNIINHDLWKDSMANLDKLVHDFKISGRDTKTRGRPSIWAAVRQEGEDSANNVDQNDLKASVKRKAIKARDKAENDNSILWTEDIIGSLKRGKERNNRLKTCKEEITDDIEDSEDTRGTKKKSKRGTRRSARKPIKANK